MTKKQIEELDKIIGTEQTQPVRHWGVCTAHCPFCQKKFQDGVIDMDCTQQEQGEQIERFKIYHILFHGATNL
jgi:hypothetical protein